MMKRLLFIATLVAVLVPVGSVLAQSKICTSSSGPCTAEEVGVFMQGISSQCGNSGTCSLDDIMIVFENVGNFVLSIVGALVLLMYIIGGMHFLAAGGSQERISKGKQYLKFATLGLVIVMFAYVGVNSLRNAIVSGEIACVPGEACGDNMICSDQGSCITECANTHPDGNWSCIDINTPGATIYGGCTSGLCPGPTEIQCCQIYSGGQSSTSATDRDSALDETLQGLSE